MILVIDNYDSFTYNLVQRLGEIDASLDIRVFRNDQIDIESIKKLAPAKIIISPGPCTPKEAGISNECLSLRRCVSFTHSLARTHARTHARSHSPTPCRC